MPDTALFWFVFAALVAMAEVFSGTFYLLAVALGLAGVWRWRQRSILSSPTVMDLDLGAEVALVSYQTGNPHHGRVRYRGCEWDAQLSFAGSPPPVGSLGKITGHEANCLLVTLPSTESEQPT